MFQRFSIAFKSGLRLGKSCLRQHSVVFHAGNRFVCPQASLVVHHDRDRCWRARPSTLLPFPRAGRNHCAEIFPIHVLGPLALRSQYVDLDATVGHKSPDFDWAALFCGIQRRPNAIAMESVSTCGHAPHERSQTELMLVPSFSGATGQVEGSSIHECKLVEHHSR